MSNPDDPRTWIAKAENDLLNVRNNLNAEQVRLSSSHKSAW